MKFNIQKLHHERVKLEQQIKECKEIIKMPHGPFTGASEAMRERSVLRNKLTFIYSAIAYTKNKIHFSSMTDKDQADYLLARLKYSRQLLVPKEFCEHEFVGSH